MQAKVHFVFDFVAEEDGTAPRSRLFSLDGTNTSGMWQAFTDHKRVSLNELRTFVASLFETSKRAEAILQKLVNRVIFETQETERNGSVGDQHLPPHRAEKETVFDKARHV